MATHCPFAPLPTYPLCSKASALAPHLTRDSVQCSPKDLIATPPASPPNTTAGFAHELSLLVPVERYQEISPGVRWISAEELGLSLRRVAEIPMPEPDSVFPWLHGIHPKNEMQRKQFKVQDDKDLSPPSSYRGLTVVHSTRLSQEGDVFLAGSSSEDSIIRFDVASDSSVFHETDALDGIKLRSFDVQVKKLATLSDIVVYHPSLSGSESDTTIKLAQRFAEAQKSKRDTQTERSPLYTTFVVRDRVQVLESKYPSLIVKVQNGSQNFSRKDFAELERDEMREMGKAAEISQNVFLGTSQDWTSQYRDTQEALVRFGVNIDCNVENPKAIPSHEVFSLENRNEPIVTSFSAVGTLRLATPGKRLQWLLGYCAWIYYATHVDEACEPSTTHSDLVSQSMQPAQNRRVARNVLLSCHDGYSETSFLALAYIIYSECLRLDAALRYLHKDKRRDFSLYKEELAWLEQLDLALIEASPVKSTRREESLANRCSPWLSNTPYLSLQPPACLPIGLPSRILDHLYLGNLDNANNKEMLLTIGIDRVLSIGEQPLWTLAAALQTESQFQTLFIDNLVDDGISSISSRIEQCLDFIEEGNLRGRNTLVHCKVGVSRSATICIAEVIRRTGKSIEDAYILVRARRLNVIIQPNLRLMYELFCWAQEEQTRKCPREDGQSVLLAARTIEWPDLADNIARLNVMHMVQ